MSADSLKPGKLIAELRLKEPPAQCRQNFSNWNALRTARQRIPACLTANASDKFALPQNAHQFGDIGNRQCFGTPDFGNRQALALSGTGNAEQTSQSVLFLCTQFHTISLASGH